MYYADYFIKILYGGKVHWEYSKRFHEWSLRLAYYKTTPKPRMRSQVLRRKPPYYCSGFVSRERGRHWNSKRKR